MAAVDAPAPSPSPRPAGSQQNECNLLLAVFGLAVIPILGCIFVIVVEFLFLKPWPSAATATAFSILGVLFSPLILYWLHIIEQQRPRGLWAWIKLKVAYGFLFLLAGLSLMSFVYLSDKLGFSTIL